MFSFTGRFTADNLNKVKNLCSKSIGEKMKVEERWSWTLQVEFKNASHVLFSAYFVNIEKGTNWRG